MTTIELFPTDTMTNEATSYKTLKANIARGRDRIDRMENRQSSGMPDVTMTLDGCDAWVEIKTPRNEPARDSTPLLGSNHRVSQEQANWLLGHSLAGGNGFVYIDSPSRRYLIRGNRASAINSATVMDLMTLAEWTAPVPTRAERWAELREVLRGRL